MGTPGKKIADSDFEDIKVHAEKIAENYSERDALCTEMENMFLLEDSNLPNDSYIKETLAPDPRVTLLGAVRLLTAADPEFSVPNEFNSVEVRKKSSPLEKAAKAMWYASSRIRKKPIHYDLALSGLLYGEEHMFIMSTKDMYDAATTPAEKARAERAMKMTPILFDVINPKLGYASYDRLGLAAYAMKQEIGVYDARTRYGDAVSKMLADKKDYDTVELNEYWNNTNHAVWFSENADDPVIAMEHGLPFIPIVAQITEGSNLFVDSGQDKIQPFLYTLYKSNLWKRRNLSLTVLYTMMNAIGTNPLFLYKRKNPEKHIEVDWSKPGGIIEIEADEDFSSLAKHVIDDSILQGLEISDRLTEEATIFKQTLGQPLGANAPFSMVALLSQAGRLPLVPYQRLTNFAISDGMRMAFELIKIEGGSKEILGEEGMETLVAKEIPETFEIFANLDISMPQDERQQVIMATQATFGEDPLVSKKYARERWMKIGQSDEMQEEIWGERFSNQEAQMAYTQQQMILAQQQQMIEQQMAMQAEQQMMAQQQQGMSPGGAPPMMPGQPMPPQQPMPGDPSQMMPGEMQAMNNQLGNVTAQPGVPGVPQMMPGDGSMPMQGASGIVESPLGNIMGG
jgi:hypothetical protein